METAVKRLYEAMFLVDSAQASDWDTVESTIKKILKKAKAEIVSIGNWSERKLAYEIKSKSRGTYVLCYFRADSEKIPTIEQAVQLSEEIMRVLILSAENREKEALEGVTATLPDSSPHEAVDKGAVSEAEGESELPQEGAEAVEGAEPVSPEDTVDEPEVEEEAKSDHETVEEVTAGPETAETGEPEKAAEPEASDAGEPEQPETETDTTEKDTSV